MDSDEDAPPPPPPSSPPPGGEPEEKATVSRSDKFKALQGILSSVPTMYSSPRPPGDRAAPPPSKRPHKELANDEDSINEESPKLKHTTKDRPKRKVRPPSRKDKSGRGAGEPKSEDQLEDTTLTEEMPPDLPPPPPPLSDLPSETSDYKIEVEDSQKEESPSLTETPALTEYSKPDHKSPHSSLVSRADISTPHSAANTDRLTVKKSLSNSPRIKGGGSHEDTAESTVDDLTLTPATPPLPSSLSTSPSVTGSPRSKGIVMGSFSERLKRIRENRSSRKGSPSLKTSTSTTVASDKQNTARQTSLSDLMTTSSSLTTSLTTSPALSIRSTSSSVSYGGDSTSSVSAFRQRTSSGVEAYTEPLRGTSTTSKNSDAHKRVSDTELVSTPRVASSISLDASSLESEEEQKSQQYTTRRLHAETDVLQPSMNGENAESAGTDANGKETWNDVCPSLDDGAPPQIRGNSPATDFPPMDDDDDDDMPTAPPPPIPDLPPPSDDLPVGSDHSEESEDILEDNGQSTADEVPKEVKMTTKSSFRTLRRKEEWKRKSEELDSGMFDPLPLLVSNKTSKSHLPDSVPEEDESPKEMKKNTTQLAEEVDKDILHGSSESLPSLPESPPPQLPDGPPPDLPSSFPPDKIEFESDALEEIIISETLLTPPLGDIERENEETKTTSLPSLDTTAPVIEDVKEPPAPKSLPASVSSPESTPPLGNGTPKEKHGDRVELRKPKRATNGASPLYRRSAFDALVAVEPTTEEKKEPKLSAEQRRSLALEASRRSDADTSTFLEQWNHDTLPPDSHETKSDDENSDLSTLKEINMNDEPEKQEKSNEVKEVIVDVISRGSKENTNGQKVKLLSTEALTMGRPRSITGIDNLKPNLRHMKEDESRWSLPPDSEVFQKIDRELASKNGSSSLGRDQKFTNISKDKWKNTDLQMTGENPSLSASTGHIFSGHGKQQHHDKKDKAGVSTSWRSLHSSSESLPPFVGLKRSPQKQPRRPHSVSPLAAAAVSVASTGSKEEPISQTNMDERTDVSDSPQQISYAQKLRVQSKASERKRRSLILSEDDHVSTPTEYLEDDLTVKGVPLRNKRNLKNLQLASIQADSAGLDSPRPASLVLDRDILRTDPSKWCIDEVCQWLELIGLGAFRQAFRERGVDGALLLQIDVQLFDELGVDSHEIREVFLAKIYELSNPRFSTGGMEDDFRLTVDEYTNEDWKKFQAAVSVLKSPLLGDSVELLEPSAIGEYIHTDYIRSHSTPNISKITDMQCDLTGGQYMSPGHHFVFPSPIEDDRSNTLHDGQYPGSQSLLASHNRWRRKSEPFATPVLGADLLMNEISSDERLAEWVAELPDSSYGRSRALTAPSRGPMQRIRKSSDSEVTSPPFRQTLPRDLKLDDTALLPDRQSSGGGGIVEDEPKMGDELSTPTRKSPKREKRHSRQQSSSPVKSEASLAPAGFVRLHMDTIQKGTYYKSFVADTSTTAEQLVKLALEKIDVSTQEYRNFCIVEKTVGEKGQLQRKAMKPSQPILAVQSQWPEEDGYCFELRRKRLPQQDKGESPQHPSTAAATTSDKTDNKLSQEQLPWEQEKVNLQRQLESIKLQLQSKEGLEEKLKSLQDENSDMSAKLEGLKKTQHTTSSDLQDKVDALSLEKRKLEDQFLMLRAAATTKSGDDVHLEENAGGPDQLLEQVQSRYEAEVRSLTGELREKERQHQEMCVSISEMESKMVELKDKSEEIKRNNRLLAERNIQIHSLEKDLAIKEEAIQKLRVELEESQLSADQMLAYQKTLQAMDMTSKQQQEFTNRTVRDLKEQLSRLTIENNQQEQLAQAVRKERDRLAREQQAKDALVASLEADLTSYRTLCSASATESSRVQALQQSLSVHEVAIASLRGEFQRHSSELKLAGEEATRLRKSLAKKEQQLILLSEEPSRTSFFDLLSDLPPHTLATAEIFPPTSILTDEGEGSEGSKETEQLVGDRGEDSTIKVMSSPGAARVSGSVVVSVPKHLQGCGVQPRDWVLEINGTNVASMSYRETNKLLLHHNQAGNAVKMVVARPLDPLAPNDAGFPLQDGGTTGADSIEQYQKLNTSLNAKLEFQSAEVDHWKQECDRFKDDMVRYAIAQKDKDSELKYLQAAIQELKYQLEDSEKARTKLEEAARNTSHLKKGELEVSLEKMKEELRKMKSAEKARVVQLKKLQQDKNKALQVLRQHMMSSDDLHDAMRDNPPTEEASLSKASRSELIKRLRNVEDDFSRHKVYLDQLLTVIIDQNPQLLSMLGEVQRLRDQMEADADSWC